MWFAKIMENIKANYRSIMIILLLIAGLLAGVYLVQKQQLFKSKASSEVNSAIKATDENGKELEYQGNSTFKTDSRKINIGIKDLQQLK